VSHRCKKFTWLGNIARRGQTQYQKRIINRKFYIFFDVLWIFLAQTINRLSLNTVLRMSNIIIILFQATTVTVRWWTKRTEERSIRQATNSDIRSYPNFAVLCPISYRYGNPLSRSFLYPFETLTSMLRGLWFSKVKK